MKKKKLYFVDVVKNETGEMESFTTSLKEEESYKYALSIYRWNIENASYSEYKDCENYSVLLYSYETDENGQIDETTYKQIYEHFIVRDRVIYK